MMKHKRISTSAPERTAPDIWGRPSPKQTITSNPWGGNPIPKPNKRTAPAIWGTDQPQRAPWGDNSTPKRVPAFWGTQNDDLLSSEQEPAYTPGNPSTLHSKILTLLMWLVPPGNARTTNYFTIQNGVLSVQVSNGYTQQNELVEIPLVHSDESIKTVKELSDELGSIKTNQKKEWEKAITAYFKEHAKDNFIGIEDEVYATFISSSGEDLQLRLFGGDSLNPQPFTLEALSQKYQQQIAPKLHPISSP